MRSDCPSMPTRGSRLVGLLSMIMTSVERSSGCEQESRGDRKLAVRITKIALGSDARGLNLRVLCIRDLPQDRGTLCPCCRGNVRGTPMPRLVGQQGEGQSFFRIRRDAELVGKAQRDPESDQFSVQHGHERRVLCSSAGNDHFLKALISFQDVTLNCVGDGACGESRRGCHYVGLAGAAAELKKAAHVFAAEFFAAGGSRRLLAEERRPCQSRNDAVERASRTSDSSVAVVAFGEEFCHHAVDDHVARASVEGRDLKERRVSGNRGQVGDSADVLCYAAYALVAIEKVVEKRHERRAFAVRGHVSGTKIGNDRYTQPRSDDSGFPGLPSYRQLAAEKSCSRSLVIEGLSMTADEVEFYAMLACCLCDSLSVEFAKKKIQPRQIGHASQLRVHHFQNRAADSGGERIFLMRKKRVERAPAPAGRHPHDGNIDPVGGGAAHDSGDDHAAPTSALSLLASVASLTSSPNSHRRRDRRSIFWGVGDGVPRLVKTRRSFFRRVVPRFKVSAT